MLSWYQVLYSSSPLLSFSGPAGRDNMTTSSAKEVPTSNQHQSNYQTTGVTKRPAGPDDDGMMV
jgi:hypothetical protein